MDFNDYQRNAMETNFSNELPDDCNPLLYFALKLNGEAGEVAEKVGKLFRDRKGKYDPEWIRKLEHEIGGVMWYLAAIADHFQISLSDIAQMNLDQLRSRQERGVLGGSGDDR